MNGLITTFTASKGVSWFVCGDSGRDEVIEDEKEAIEREGGGLYSDAIR